MLLPDNPQPKAPSVLDLHLAFATVVDDNHLEAIGRVAQTPEPVDAGRQPVRAATCRDDD